MRLYTRTGDAGETGLIGGARISKASLRIEAIGQVDELNALVGVARTHSHYFDMDSELAQIQNSLFDLGGELASPDGSFVAIRDAHAARLERSIDAMTNELEPLRQFILPGGTPLAASLHLCRTVCRRAERAVLALNAEKPVRSETLRYMNRLSDWFFAAARTANRLASVPDVPWSRTEVD